MTSLPWNMAEDFLSVPWCYSDVFPEMCFQTVSKHSDLVPAIIAADVILLCN